MDRRTDRHLAMHGESALCIRVAYKVASSLTDVRQQVFKWQDIAVMCTIHFHPWLHENYSSAPEPGDTD